MTYQSKVIGIKDMPVDPPNNWFIITLLGLIHVTNANTLKNWARKPLTDRSVSIYMFHGNESII